MNELNEVKRYPNRMGYVVGFITTFMGTLITIDFQLKGSIEHNARLGDNDLEKAD